MKGGVKSKRESLSSPGPSTSTLEIDSSTGLLQVEDQISILPNVCIPSSDNHKSFESLLLEQIKQTPKTITNRKRTCGGAEAIKNNEGDKTRERNGKGRK